MTIKPHVAILSLPGPIACAPHDSWTRTYDNPGLYEWLLSYSR